MSTPQQWLAEADTTLALLGKVTLNDLSPASFALLESATTSLAKLSRGLQRFTLAERQALQPRITALQARITSTMAALASAGKDSTRQISNLRQHGQALSAYLLSDSKK